MASPTTDCSVLPLDKADDSCLQRFSLSFLHPTVVCLDKLERGDRAWSGELRLPLPLLLVFPVVSLWFFVTCFGFGGQF